MSDQCPMRIPLRASLVDVSQGAELREVARTDSVSAKRLNHDGTSTSRTGCVVRCVLLERHVPSDHLLRSIDRFLIAETRLGCVR